MKSLMNMLLQAMFAAFLGLGMVGCEERTPTTEVNDKLLGGKEIKKTEVIEKNDSVEVRETETDVNSDGEITEKEVEVTEHAK